MMVSVLRRLKWSGLLDAYPNLTAYLARGHQVPPRVTRLHIAA